MFTVGQKVIGEAYGEGVVVEVEDEGDYPVRVSFLSGEWDCYTSDGKWHIKCDQSLSVIEE